MGYTHYWKHAEFTPAEWSQLQECTRAIIGRARAAGIGIAGWDGNGAPDLNPEGISLNGREPDSYETFLLSRGAESFGFCKTGRAPYDAAIVAILTAAARIAPDRFHWSSDGDGAEHEPGRALAHDLPTPGAWGGGCTVRA